VRLAASGGPEAFADTAEELLAVRPRTLAAA